MSVGERRGGGLCLFSLYEIVPGLSFPVLALTLQTVLRYHEPPPRAAVTFTLRVNTEMTNCSQANARVLTVRILAR